MSIKLTFRALALRFILFTVANLLLNSLVCFKRVMLQLLDQIKGQELLANTEITMSVSEFIFINSWFSCEVIIFQNKEISILGKF